MRQFAYHPQQFSCLFSYGPVEWWKPCLFGHKICHGQKRCCFRFSNIDGNVAYDSLDIRERDEQEKYFDEDEEEEMRGSSKSSSTGDLSFLTPSEFRHFKKLSEKMSPLRLEGGKSDCTSQTDTSENKEVIEKSASKQDDGNCKLMEDASSDN